jgi:hypothetical protein
MFFIGLMALLDFRNLGEMLKTPGEWTPLGYYSGSA